MTARGDAALARLGMLARASGIAPEPLIASCLGERFLHRLAASPHTSTFVVKGGHLFDFWDADGRRPTLDVDLGCERLLAPAELEALVSEIARVDLDDGARFDAGPVRTEASFAGLPMGARVAVPASLGSAALRLKVDVTYCQPVTPGPEIRWHHGLMADLPPARLACAPQETMIAEKLAIAVEFGPDNTRTRDYYDLWHLSRTRSFEGELAQLAVRATFAARKAAAYLERDDDYWAAGFAPAFAAPGLARSWRVFRDDFVPHRHVPEFRDVAREVAAFALPLLRSVRDHRGLGPWAPGRGWRAPRDLRAP